MSLLTDSPRAVVTGVSGTDLPEQGIFHSVTCLADASLAGRTARRQAAQVAGDDALVHTVAPSPRSWRDRDGLLRLCCDSDIVVAGSAVPASALEHACCPVLVSRWLPLGVHLGERILLAVDQEADPTYAAAISGALAARCRGDVTIVPAITHGSALQRSIARSRRVVLEATGIWPETVGTTPTQVAGVAAAARDMDASMVVIPRGASPGSRSAAADISRHLMCPVMIVPSATARGPAPPRESPD